MNQLIDLKDSYNAHLRARRTKRQVAWLFLLLATCLVAVSLGCLFSLAGTPGLCLTSLAIIAAGVYSATYLLTRH